MSFIVVFFLHYSRLTAEHREWEMEDIGWQARMPLSPGHLFRVGIDGLGCTFAVGDVWVETVESAVAFYAESILGRGI